MNAKDKKTMFARAMYIMVILALAFSVTGNAYAAEEGVVEIRWFVGLGTGSAPEQQSAQQQVVYNFNTAHSGIHLTVEFVDNGIARDVLAQEIADGNPPDIVGPVGFSGANAFHDQWMDLTDLIATTGYDMSQFSPELVELYQTDIGQEGLPFAVFPSAIYYNPALFDKAGLNYPPDAYGEKYELNGDMVDWDWDTVATVARLLTIDAAGKNATEDGFDPNAIAQYGFSAQWQDHPFHFGSYWQASAAFQGTAGSYTAQFPQGWKDAWHWQYSGMWGDQPFIPTGPVANDVAFNYDNVFPSGKIAMVEQPSWYLCCVGEPQFQFAPTPSYNGEIGGRVDADTFRILETTTHPEDAFEVLTYLVGPAVDVLLPVYGGISALVDEQQDFITMQSERYPYVTQASWDILLAGLNYPDVPSAEGWMPNFDTAWDRGSEFRDMLEWNGGIDLDFEISCYEKNLQDILNGQPFSGCNYPWRDEFDGPLADGWYWAGNENPDNWGFNDGFLRIDASSLSTGGENLLLRSVGASDFSIETRLFFTPDTNFQFAGLIIWQDERNFLQFGRAYCDIEGPCVGNGIYFDKVLNGEMPDTNFATQIENPFDPAEAYLRLERRGEMVRAFYSHEGITWTEIGTHWIPPEFQVYGVGLTNSQNFYSASGNSAYFDYFELTEGWGFLPEGFHDGDAGDVPSWACNANGWAVDPDNHEADIAVEVNVDGTSYFANASEYREDLDNAGVCADGKCGFSMSLWDTITSYEMHNVTAYAQDIESGEWVRLYNSPKELTCRTYDVYAYDPLTSTTKQITGLEGTELREKDEYDPTWSPNGKLVAHDVVTSDSHQIHVTDVKTGVSTVLQGTEDGGNDAAWSPNGKWIAFDRRWFDNDQNIYIVPATGGDRSKSEVVENAVTASWAPSGKRIAFQSPDGSIRTAPVDGGKGGETLIAEFGGLPAWSPDGNWIAYSKDGDIWKVQVNALGVRKGEPIQLTSGPFQDGKPTWSPDSQTIIYDSNFGPDSDLWSIPATGGIPTWLTGAPVFGDYGPANARNSATIAYASPSPEGQAPRTWISAYTYDLPAGYWTENTHTYRFLTSDNPDGEGRSFDVSIDNPLYDGTVLLRPGTIRAMTSDGCTNIDVINPNQRTQFHVGWTFDGTYTDALTYYQNLTAQVGWDNETPVDMLQHEIFPFTAPLDWFGYTCTFTAGPPAPNVIASITEDWFYTQSFAPNTTLEFSIYASKGGVSLWNGTATTDDFGFVWVNAEGNWNLEPGNYLVVSDGAVTKSLEIEGFTFDVFNLSNGQLSGTAPAPFGRRVWVGIGWENDGWSMDVTTDETGAWMADFGQPVSNDYWWVAAQVFDADGDASELRPTSQIIFLRPSCGNTYTVQPNIPLEIRYGSWVAIGEERANQNADHLTVELVLNGETVIGEKQPVVPSSEIPCGTPREDAYGVFYVAEVGPLSSGTYNAEVTWSFDALVTDGYDADGDGELEWYGPGEILTREFTIIVP